MARLVLLITTFLGAKLLHPLVIQQLEKAYRVNDEFRQFIDSELNIQETQRKYAFDDFCVIIKKPYRHDEPKYFYTIYLETDNIAKMLETLYGEFVMYDGTVCPYTPVYKRNNGRLEQSSISKYLRASKERVDEFVFKMMMI